MTGDRLSLEQVFSNMIDNAVKYLDPKRPGQIRVEGQDLADGMVEYRIIDNGRGLPGENRHRLLEPYMTMRDKGTGLGLAIVKKIIDDHGGTIQLRDAPADVDEGRGAMITVRLPMEARTSTEQEENEREPADGV